MECELNPRIPYTELSHIIKKQKEVRPGRSALGNRPVHPPWAQACAAERGHCSQRLQEPGLALALGSGCSWCSGPVGSRVTVCPPRASCSPCSPPNPPFPPQIIKKLIERKQAQIRKVYPGLTCFKEGVRQIPIESVPGIRESCGFWRGRAVWQEGSVLPRLRA